MLFDVSDISQVLLQFSILSSQMAGVVQGRFSKTVQKVSIIDCRYPYEFEGGHIQVNICLFLNS